MFVRRKVKKLTVSARMKSHEPMYPPIIVYNWWDANHGLYNCIVQNNITANTDDKTNETLVETAKMKKVDKLTEHNLNSCD